MAKIRILGPNQEVLETAETVPVEESHERWSDILLADGTRLRARLNIGAAVRVDNQYTPDGLPLYRFNTEPIIVAVDAPAQLRRPEPGGSGR